MENKIRILSTKKLLTHQKHYLLNANFEVFEDDFIETQNKNFEIDKINDCLIFTSKNAVESVLLNKKWEEIKTKKCFCVGKKTREILEQNGFDILESSDYASELASIICNKFPKISFTFFCGNLRRDILPNTLKENGINFNEIEVYETNITSKKVTNKADGILFFSPSAVESYIKFNSIKDEICFCIGKTTAEALVPKLRDKKVKNIIIAEKPSVENVIIEVVQYYN